MGHRDQLYYSCQVLIVLCLSLLSPFSLLQVFLVWLHLIFVASFAPTNRTITVKLWLLGSEFRPVYYRGYIPFTPGDGARNSAYDCLFRLLVIGARGVWCSRDSLRKASY